MDTGIVIECMSRWSVYLYIHKGRNPLSVVAKLPDGSRESYDK